MLSTTEVLEIMREQQLGNYKEQKMKKEQIQQKINELQSLLNEGTRTEYNIILDRSGSMQSIKSDMEGGFKAWIENEKKLEGIATVNLYQFDDIFETVYEGRTLDNANLTLVPRGGTALNDGIGKTIGIVKDRHKNSKPDRTIFVIITDGEENSSRELTASSVKNLVEQETKQNNWVFLYIGANQDAVLTGKDRGINIGRALNYASTPEGTSDMWKNVSKGTSKLRCASNMSYSNMAQDKEEVFNSEN